jgi:hypothetical protein
VIEQYSQAQGWAVRRVDNSLRVANLLTVKPQGDGQTKVQAKAVRSTSWDAIRPVLDAEYERVWGRASTLGAKEIGAQVADAISELEVEASASGHVRLRSVYNVLKRRRPKGPGRVASLYRDEFSADLSTLRADEKASQQFDFAAARDQTLSFDVVEPDGRLLQYGYIRKR